MYPAYACCTLPVRGEVRALPQGLDPVIRNEFKNMLPAGHGDLVIVKTVFEDHVWQKAEQDRGPKDHVNIMILQIIVSGIPFVLGLRTRT